MTQFVHLKVHSEFSLTDGLVRLKPLMAALKERGIPAVALTDNMNLFAAVKLQNTAEKHGIKPILGADICLAANRWWPEQTRLTLLAQNLVGYRNITKLVSSAYLGQAVASTVELSLESLFSLNEGVIVLSGGQAGVLGQLLSAGQSVEAGACLSEFQSIYGDRFYIELQRVGRPNEDRFCEQSAELAAAKGCAVVATNDVRFLDQSDYEAHEARVCINQSRVLSDPKRPRDYTDQQYLRSESEMLTLFSDFPEALENSVEIAKRCSAQIPLGENFLPVYPIPEGMTETEFFREVSKKGLVRRLDFLKESQPDLNETPYWDRLVIELDIIIQMGFSGYFLIVMDFIQWAKNNGIPVGPGRGSGAGSLVAYVLDITDIDPLAYDLLFERFLNPERVSMPDFDVDFCMDGRDRVIDYVAETYGRFAVSQIITYGSMAAKAVIRDVGRVQDKPYGFVDRIAKLVPFEIGMTLTKALQDEPQLSELYEKDEEAKDLLEMALKLEGLTRNVGKHAGGVVIAPSDLTDFVPLYCDETGANLVTQFDKDDVEQAGLVKFDFLGLRTLTIIDWAIKNVEKASGERLDIARIPLDDEATFELLISGQTTAVFQLESRGMQELIKRLKPNCFEDIVALVALFRPGPLQSGMVDDFINRKHGKAEVKYSLPELEPVLQTTYGVILYQEQVMKIAQVLAGYTLGEADMLRRAMGKKKPEEMAKQREIFMAGSEKNGFPSEKASEIFDLMEKFAGYGFNKSHSAAYALVSYQTAWLKTHYTSAFMAAVMSSDMDNTDKVVHLTEECEQLRLGLRAPCVNTSQFAFTVGSDAELVYGLGAIKGVGEGPVDSIITERKANGVFDNLFEFCERVDLKKLNKRTLEALIWSGALDALGPEHLRSEKQLSANRATLLASYERAVKAADQKMQTAQMGMMDLFGHSQAQTRPDFLEAVSLTENERLMGERNTLGHYLSGHPIKQFEELINKITSFSLKEARPSQQGRKKVTIAGLVVALRTMKSKRGGRIGFLTIDDGTARMEVSVFGEVYEQYREVLVKDAICVIEGEVQLDDYSGQLKFVTRSAVSIESAAASYARRICLKLNPEKLPLEFSGHLKKILAPRQNGSCPIMLECETGTEKGTLALGEQWSVDLDLDLLSDLKQLLAHDQVILEY